MSVKVDFYRDAFNRIWLLQTGKLITRSRRVVPSEGSHLLSDFILKKMKEVEMKEAEEAK